MLGFRGRGAGVQTLGPAARRSGRRSEDADGARSVPESPPTQPPEMDIAMDAAVLGFCSPGPFPLSFFFLALSSVLAVGGLGWRNYGLKDSCRDLQLNCAISYFFIYIYCSIHVSLDSMWQRECKNLEFEKNLNSVVIWKEVETAVLVPGGTWDPVGFDSGTSLSSTNYLRVWFEALIFFNKKLFFEWYFLRKKNCHRLASRHILDIWVRIVCLAAQWFTGFNLNSSIHLVCRMHWLVAWLMCWAYLIV
jgi:hypothetical protein